MKNEKLRCCARLPYDTVFCIVTVLSLCVGEAYMPPGRGLTHAGFAVGCPFAPVCRAGVHARRTHIKIILKKSSVRRGQGPALQCKANTMPPRQRAMAAMFAGGMYAAPTHRPSAVATKKRYGKTNVAGRMHAARGRSPCGDVFGFVYAIPGVCRGGIYASRQGCAPRGVCGWLPVPLAL